VEELSKLRPVNFIVISPVKEDHLDVLFCKVKFTSCPQP
jgi:hypothetical protein